MKTTKIFYEFMPNKDGADHVSMTRWLPIVTTNELSRV